MLLLAGPILRKF